MLIVSYETKRSLTALIWGGDTKDEDETMSLISRIDHKAQLMGEMMRCVGADLSAMADITGESQLRNAMWRCMACRKGDACEAWLASAKPGSPAPDFCNNAGLFNDMRD